MRAERSWRGDAEAVSPVIATILMVALTIVLAATMFVLVSGIQEKREEVPTTNFEAFGDNANDDIVVQFLAGGEPFQPGDWRISVTEGRNSNPVYTLGSTNLSAGDQMVFNTTTDPGTEAATGDTYEGAGAAVAIVSGTYRILIFYIPAESTIFDDDVVVA